MDELNSLHDKLEANTGTLKKFEGLEIDLLKFHVDLKTQFSEYREAIESANLSENDRKEQLIRHDELLKSLHKAILEAKHLARKRTEQMTRDELFKMSQERQKASKPQTAEDKIGEEVTKSLKRMLETMKTEVERSSANISTARSTSKNLQGTSDNYEKLSGTLDESKGLIRDLWKRNRMDMIYIMGALGVFIATVAYVLLQRTPGVVWLPGKAVYRTILNLMPKSSERIVEKLVQVTESILSESDEQDEIPPEMFVDSVDTSVEYGNDSLLKETNETDNSYKGQSEKHESSENADETSHENFGHQIHSEKSFGEEISFSKSQWEEVKSDESLVTVDSSEKPDLITSAPDSIKNEHVKSVNTVIGPVEIVDISPIIVPTTESVEVNSSHSIDSTVYHEETHQLVVDSSTVAEQLDSITNPVEPTIEDVLSISKGSIELPPTTESKESEEPVTSVSDETTNLTIDPTKLIEPTSDQTTTTTTNISETFITVDSEPSTSINSDEIDSAVSIVPTAAPTDGSHVTNSVSHEFDESSKEYSSDTDLFEYNYEL